MTFPVTRREFVKTAGGAAATAVAAAAAAGVAPALAQSKPARRRYAIVGTGDRAVGMWGRPLVKEYGDVLEFAGLCDVNPKRVQVAKQMIYLTKSFGMRRRIPVVRSEGGHGGGDTRLRDLMFRNADAPDHMRLPDSRAGAMSCLTGIAARKSIDERRSVRISDLVRL